MKTKLECGLQGDPGHICLNPLVSTFYRDGVISHPFYQDFHFCFTPNSVAKGVQSGSMFIHSHVFQF